MNPHPTPPHHGADSKGETTQRGNTTTRHAEVMTRPASHAQSNPTQGFTLIEILVVIGIISVLSAVLVPNLLTARTKGTEQAVKSCANEIMQQGYMFLSDNHTFVGFDATGAFQPRSCQSNLVTAISIDTADHHQLAGTVTGATGTVFEFDTASGIAQAP